MIAQSHDVAVHMYADDTQLYLPFDLSSPVSAHQAVIKLEDCIEDIRKWMSANKLKLNDDKSELIIFTPSRQSHKCDIQHIRIGDHNVPVSQNVRNLGVQFDSVLNMKHQVNSIVRKSNFQLRSIGQVRQYLSHDAACTLVHACLSSRLDNGNSLLFGISDSLLHSLQKVQNTAARIITRTKKYDHITPHLKDLHWLPLEYRIRFKILTLTYKCLNNMGPRYLAELLDIHVPERELRSCDTLMLNVPKTRLKSYGDRAFSHAAPMLWNTLPKDVKGAESLDIFKKRLKTYFFDKSFN